MEGPIRGADFFLGRILIRILRTCDSTTAFFIDVYQCFFVVLPFCPSKIIFIQTLRAFRQASSQI